MAYLPTGGARTCEDGYNWRKYGQRSVKTSQYPRSYYKCSHPNCNVKRKLQRSPDGQITEIIYDGVHNHPRHDQYNQEEILRTSFLHNQMLEASDASRAEEGEAGSEWGVGGLETSTSVLTANSDPWSKPEVNLSCAIFESDGTSELSPGDAAADDDDESESKRRKIEISAPEPRVVVLTDSGVDVLDDGYCWRKYGKKIIKGNVNPRSYFRCISKGCSVRKQVERVSHNWKSVSTTYDGKHNHEVPAVKKMYWVGDGTIFPTATSTQPTFDFARNVNCLKAEAQSQVHSPFFQRLHQDLDNGTVLSALLGDYQFGVGAISPTVSTTQPTLAFSRNANGLKAEAQYQVHSPFLQRTHQDLDDETVLSTLHGDCHGETLSPTASTTQPTLAFSRNANTPKAEAESQDHSSFFQGIHLDFDHETLLSTLLEDSNTGRKVESPPSVYQMKLENPLLRRTFVPNFPMPSSPLSISTSGSTEPSSSNVSNHDRENGYSHHCFGGMSTYKVNQAL